MGVNADFLFGASALVLSSDTPKIMRQAADQASASGLGPLIQICDGTADDVQIQAAIDALPTGGGRVILLEGIFTITTRIRLNDVIVLEGQGASTIVTQANGSNLSGLIRFEAGSSGSTVRNLKVDGNGANNTGGNGIDCIDSTVGNITVEAVTVINCTDGEGIQIGNTSNCISAVIVKSIFTSNNRNGIHLAYATNAIIADCISESDLASGINLESTNTTSRAAIVNCIVDSSGSDGIIIDPFNTGDVTDVAITSCIVRNAGRDGIRYIYGIRGIIEGCIVDTPTANGITCSAGGTETVTIANNIIKDAGGHGIDALTAGARAIIIGNRILSATTDGIRTGAFTLCLGNWVYSCGQYGIYVAGDREAVTGNCCRDNDVGIYLKDGVTIANLIIKDNQLYSNTTANLTPPTDGSGNIIQNNIGYVTENSGTAAVSNGQTTVVVTHGLATTPTRVLLTARLWSNAAKAWVTTLTATQFTINVDADPGAGTAIFDWRAQVGEG